jgi:hypothetical protein
VTVEIFGAPATEGVATVLCRSLGSRMRRAALALGAAWLLTLPAIFFPVLHFVLVPGLIIGGVVLGAMRLREDRTLARLRGTCPRCGMALNLTPGSRFRLPRSAQCLHCKNQLTLTAVASRTGPAPTR